MEYNENDEVKPFDYCDKVDLHALEQNVNFERVCLIANEHGFRGIVTPLVNLDSLVKTLKSYGYNHILPICAIDYPFGSLSLDVRNYCIMSAKEKGAREIEICAPYHHIATLDTRKIGEDAQSITATAKKASIGLKYVFDQNGPFVDDNVRSKMARIISNHKIPAVSNSLGFFEDKADHADNIIKMRTMKSKSGCDMKIYLETNDVEDIASYVKAGADIIGLPWNKAAYLIHEYENLIHKKES